MGLKSLLTRGRVRKTFFAFFSAMAVHVATQHPPQRPSEGFGRAKTAQIKQKIAIWQVFSKNIIFWRFPGA